MSTPPAARFYQQASRMDNLAWEVCRYVRRGDDKKDGCSSCSHTVRGIYGEEDAAHPMCRLLAEEVIAKVLEATYIDEKIIASKIIPRHDPT